MPEVSGSNLAEILAGPPLSLPALISTCGGIGAVRPADHDMALEIRSLWACCQIVLHFLASWVVG